MFLHIDYWSDEGIGKIETQIKDARVIEDINVLYVMEEASALAFFINRKWHPGMDNVYKKRFEEWTPPPYTPVSTPCTPYIYEIPPIDDWDLYIQVFVEDIVKSQRLYLVVRSAFEALKKYTSWEGDIRSGLFVQVLPGSDPIKYAVIVKQDNNGTTFVASGDRLDYLCEYAVMGT